LATYSRHLPNRDKGLLWALAFSIGLHVLAVLILPNIEIEAEKTPETLTIELAPAKKIEPVTAPEPEQEIPTPPKPSPKPEPVVKPKLPPLPSPLAEPPANQPEVAPQPSSPPVMTAAPKADVTPIITAPPPPPEPPKPAGPSQQDIDAARNQYGNLLAREIAKYKQYPRIAQMRGWQGDVMLELQLDSNGNVLSAKVHDSSTYESLDKQTLEMVKKASPFPFPPEALKGRSFTILVPVSFRLE
jgi:protein TonB